MYGDNCIPCTNVLGGGGGGGYYGIEKYIFLVCIICFAFSSFVFTTSYATYLLMYIYK